MKKLLACALLALSSISFGATMNPVQLLNPTGSTAGQAIVSTGTSSAPAWGNVAATSLAVQAANTVVANVTGSSASPTAFAMPSCSTSVSALNWTTSTGFTCNTGVNAAQLGGATFASPGPIGSTTASTGAFTTLSASSTVSGTGFTTLLSPYAPLASPALTGTPTAPTAAAGTNTTQVATTGFVTGKFAAMARVLATKTTALSLTNNASTTVTGWTTSFDANSNFNASTGTFTAPATGYYLVSAQVVTASAAIAAGTVVSLDIVVNGVAGPTGETTYPTASGANTPMTMQATALVSLTSGQTVTVQAFQNSGAAVNTTTNSNSTYISVTQVP